MAVSTIDALYNGTSEKLTTSATGITVTGTVAATAYTGDGSALTGVGSPSIDDNGDATAMTITSDENILIGKTSSSLSTNGTELLANGTSLFTRSVNSGDGAGVAYFQRNASDGNIIMLYNSSTSHVGSIGTSSSALTIYPNVSVGTGLWMDSNHIEPTNRLGTRTDGTRDFGSSSYRWRDIYTSGGIYLGGGVAANKLDDYEEGTFTPVLDNVSCSYSAQTGTYTKVGNLVTARFEIGVTGLNTGDGSGFQIGDLPFVCGASGVLFTMDTENSNVITNKQNILGARPIVSADGVRLTDNGGEYAYNNGTSSSGSIIGMVQYFTT